MTEPQDFTLFWVGITIAYLIIIAMAVVGGKMIDGGRRKKSSAKH